MLCVEGRVPEPIKAQEKGVSVWAQRVGRDFLSPPPGGHFNCPWSVSAPQRWVGTEVTELKRCERRGCPCGIEAGLRFGDAARGAQLQARQRDRRVRVRPPLPPLPAPPRPQSPMAAAALRDPPEVNARPPDPHHPHRPHPTRH